jgi:hypothetical protein
MSMSMSTQLTRGAVALPMLLMFVLLGFAAGEPIQADPIAVARTGLIDSLCTEVTIKPRVLVLAQAPADLGALVIRWKAPCRA